MNIQLKYSFIFSILAFSLLSVSSANADDLSKAFAQCGFKVSEAVVGKRFENEVAMHNSQANLMSWCMKGEGFVYKNTNENYCNDLMMGTSWRKQICWEPEK